MKSSWLVAILLAATVGLSFAAPTPAAAADKRSDHHPHSRTLRGAIGWFPDSLDPQLSYSQAGWMAMYNAYIPLLTLRHADGRAGSKVIPGLARSRPRISDHGKTYTLFLRKGLRYSNGRPVKASDFKFTIERLFRLNSDGASLYAEISGAERFWRTGRGGIGGITTNDRTGRIVIHLIEPRAEFSSELALPFAAPIPRGTPAKDLTGQPPPATGPYVIASSNRPRGWSYARNPVWARNGRLMPQLPGGHVNRISVRVIHRSSVRIRAVEEGRLDWTYGPLRRDQYAELKRKYSGGRFQAEPELDTYYFWMNTKKPPFNDLKVREAVNYAVDRSVLREIYGGELAPTEQILPPGMPGYRKFTPYPHDIAKAQRLIAEANPSDRDITVWTDDESRERAVGAYYRGVLEELGFTVHLKVVKSENYFTAISKTSTPNLDTGWSNWFADYPHPNDFFELLLAGWAILPTYNLNLAQIDVPILDQLIAVLDARPGPIPEGRYAALDRIYMALAPWVPYGNPTVPLFVSRAVPLSRVIWNPSFAVDLTSFQLR